MTCGKCYRRQGQMCSKDAKEAGRREKCFLGFFCCQRKHGNMRHAQQHAIQTLVKGSSCSWNLPTAASACHFCLSCTFLLLFPLRFASTSRPPNKEFYHPTSTAEIAQPLRCEKRNHKANSLARHLNQLHGSSFNYDACDTGFRICRIPHRRPQTSILRDIAQIIPQVQAPSRQLKA